MTLLIPSLENDWLFLNSLGTPTLPFGTQFKTHLFHAACLKPSLPLEEVILSALAPYIVAFDILYVNSRNPYTA